MQRNTTSTRYVPAEEPHQTAQPPNVTADVYAVIFASLFVVLVVFGIGGRLAGWQMTVVLVTGVTLFLALMLAAILILSGWAHAWLLYRATVRKAELERDIAIGQLRVQHMQARAQLEEARNRQVTVGQLAPPVAPAFVAAEDTESRRAALAWAHQLYGPDGQPDPAKVWPSGALRGKAPHNDGLSPTSCRLLYEPDHAQPLLVREERTVRLNTDDYPTADGLGRL